MEQAILRAIGRCNPNEPLTSGDERFVDLTDVRGMSVQQRILRKIKGAEEGKRYSHIALAGHRGSGKSTELYGLMEIARGQGYLVLYAGVTEAVDENEIGYSDVFRLIAQMLVNAFENNPRLPEIPAAAIEEVEKWFRDVTGVTESEIETGLQLGGTLEVGGGVEAEGELGLPVVAKGKVKLGLGKVLGALGLIRKSTSKRRTEVRQSLEQYPQSLLNNVNKLLAAAHQSAQAAYPAGILIVLDNVDRYLPEHVDQAFIQTAQLFTELQAHLIFTIPISLIYRPVGEKIDDRYHPVSLPMLPVKKRDDDADNERVLDKLIQIVRKRIVRDDLFDDAALIREIARMSGGCPRDLLRLTDAALNQADSAVNQQHVTRAVNELADNESRRLVRAQFDRLAAVARDHEIDPDDEGRTMLFYRYVLEYFDGDTGQTWVDVHPLLKTTRKFRDAQARLAADAHTPPA